MGSSETTLAVPDRPEFAGFSAHYEVDIAPYLRAKEADRRTAASNFVILVGSLGLLAGAIAWRGPFGAANLHAAIFVAMAALGVAGWLLNRTRTDIAEGLFRRVCGALGFSHVLKLGRPDYYGAFKRLGLLPDHNIEAWEDEVRGRHSGAQFVLCESHLKMKTSNGKNTTVRTVFHGQLLLVDYPRRFLGETVVKRDAGVFNRLMKPAANFTRVGLVSSAFEKAFEAWGTDQVEARELLDPIVLERFLELERLFGGKALRAAFSGGRLLIAIETGDRLDMGSMFRPLESAARVSTILRELDVVFELIDVAIKPVGGRLQGAFTAADVR